MKPRRSLFAACALLLVSDPRGALADDGDEGFEIRTLSSKADMVSGGEVLAQVDVPARVRLSDVRVDLNGRDVTNAFRPSQAGRSLVGLLKGLAVGQNRLTVESAARGQAEASTERLAIVNHPSSGPVFSGPHQTPFVCETQSFVLPVTGASLGPPLDAQCSVATRVDYVYKSKGGAFKPLPDPAVRPADLAKTTTSLGHVVNYIARVETGTINRAIYQTAVLHDPVIEAAPDPWTRPAGWNGRLVYQFGGGCNAGYHQGRSIGQPSRGSSSILEHLWEGDRPLALGYAVAGASLNVFGTKCDDVISAETTMMVKERFIVRYGVPRHTIGSGSSGGSMQQHLIAQNYPGLLDGIQPGSSFPDTLSFALPYMDCGLLDRALNSSTQPWTSTQKARVAGHRTYDYCARNATWWFRFVHPRKECDPAIPPSLLYEPNLNRGGARCTLADDMVNVYGRDEQTGFGRRPFDNVGVQYGLAAFNAAQISAAQFLDLNQRIGGYDIDGNHLSTRMVADRDALRIAYRTGRMNAGTGGLASVPIIDFRSYRDLIGDVHDAVRSYVTRARLIAANGHAGNQVFLVGPNFPTSTSFPAQIAPDMLRLMDLWLENMANDTSEGSAAEKVIRNKPAELVDACYTDSGQKITDQATCLQLYPPGANPRLAAGEPLANDILKCQLKPVSRGDYAQPLTDEDLTRLKAIFPQGVCDYGRRGVEQQRVRRTWLSYPIATDVDDAHADEE